MFPRRRLSADTEHELTVSSSDNTKTDSSNFPISLKSCEKPKQQHLQQGPTDVS